MCHRRPAQGYRYSHIAEVGSGWVSSHLVNFLSHPRDCDYIREAAVSQAQVQSALSIE